MDGDNNSSLNKEGNSTYPEATSLRPGDAPMPVVKVLSVRGVEYLMMTLALWFGAASLIWSLVSVVNEQTGLSYLAFPIATLVVCVPIFAFFFLRLRKQELVNPALRFEPSKRRMSQITQVLAFLTCLFNIITFVYLIISKIGGDSEASLVKAFLSLLMVLAVAGGILAYYWFDEHRMSRG